jgi:hypothetical protein
MSHRLDQIKDLHEFAVRFKDKPVGDLVDIIGGLVCTLGFLAPVFFLVDMQWEPEWATTPFTPFVVYVIIGLISGALAGFLAHRTIKSLRKTKKTWLTEFDEALSRYTPIDLVAFRSFQESAKFKGFIEKLDFKNWFDAECKAFGAHVDYITKAAENVHLNADGPFLSRSIEQDLR